MKIKKGDYIEGYEYYGYDIKKIKGWVKNIHIDKENISYMIQADDKYEGARGTIIYSHLGEINKLDYKDKFKC